MFRPDFEFKAILSAIICSGLLAKHGIDHGAVEPADIAAKSIVIAQEIIARCELSEKILEEQDRILAEMTTTPLINSGDGGSASSPLG